MEPAKLTLFTAVTPHQVSKGFRLNDAGKLEKLPGGKLSDGAIEIVAINSLAEFATLLASLTPAQALAYGMPIKPGVSRVMTKRAFAVAGQPSGATTRTKDAFAWPKGPGVLMLDYDPRPGLDPLQRDALVQTMRAAVPGLTNVEMLWWPSASSCIWHGEKELHGMRGQRLYLLVEDASDIPRAGRVLFERLWLAGQGYITISSSGTLLERTPVDAAVWQPSRLDFAGGAECAPGLSQRRGAPFIVEGNQKFVDSHIAFPDLTEVERRQLIATISQARVAVQDDAEKIRTQWIRTRAQDMVASEEQGDPDSMREALNTARRALESNVLDGDFKLEVEHNGKLESVTVRQLLINREDFHGCLTRDPLEPLYDGGRLVGRLFLLQARPMLNSFAHGGRAYRLHQAPTRIELVKGQMADATNATIEILRRDPVVFDFGGELALVDSGKLHLLCEHGLAHHLGTVTQFFRRVKGKDGFTEIDCDPPPALLKQILAQSERRKLKPLAGVISGPTIRCDGSVLDSPGYDEVTRLFFDPAGEDVPYVPQRPSEDETKAALNTLMYPFETFPFVDAGARGALLSALLTAAVRPVLPTAPAFAFDAPVQGSGKTLLASCIGAMTEGRVPDVWPHTHGRDDEEIRKRLFTGLRSGNKTLVWDNVTGVFDSASMAAFITADAVTDRVLGKSASIRIPNRVLLILTGNNLQLAADLPRRVMICRIDPKTEQPFARQFSVDPLQWVLDNRMNMIAAACTLIRARIIHADQPGPGRLASFEPWDHLVRQTVVHANTKLRPGEFGDPMDLVREAQVADPEVEALFAMLTSLRSCFGSDEFSAMDVQDRAAGEVSLNALRAALIDLAGERALTSTKSLGRVLKFREGRIVRGLRLTSRPDASRGSRMYRVCDA